MPLRAPLLVLLSAGLLFGCESADSHADSVRRAQAADSRLTLGTVQREIRVGMTNTQVAETLGAPNMVTTDDERREVWVYDRISTDNAYSSSAGGVGILILGVASSAGASSVSQRTLTVVIKFDAASRVRDFSYRSSSF